MLPLHVAVTGAFEYCYCILHDAAFACVVATACAAALARCCCLCMMLLFLHAAALPVHAAALQVLLLLHLVWHAADADAFACCCCFGLFMLLVPLHAADPTVCAQCCPAALKPLRHDCHNRLNIMPSCDRSNCWCGSVLVLFIYCCRSCACFGVAVAFRPLSVALLLSLVGSCSCTW